jgi:hypothetical protein
MIPENYPPAGFDGVIWMTPEIARYIMRFHNIIPVTDKQVKELIAKIENLTFDPEPKVTIVDMSAGREHFHDGKHRLSAIIHCGKSVRLHVIHKKFVPGWQNIGPQSYEETIALSRTARNHN